MTGGSGQPGTFFVCLQTLLMSSAAADWFATAPLPDGISASDSEDERARADAREAAVARILTLMLGSLKNKLRETLR